MICQRAGYQRSRLATLPAESAAAGDAGENVLHVRPRQRAALVALLEEVAAAVVLPRAARELLDVRVRDGLLVHVLVRREPEHSERLARVLRAERGDALP